MPADLCRHIGAQRLQPRHAPRHRAEQRFQLLMMRIDFPPVGALDAQRLERADDDAAMARQIVRPDPREIADVVNPDAPAEPVVKRRAIGVARIVQRIDRLGADHVGGDQPQDERKFGVDPRIARDPDRMRGEQGLAAAGRQAQADIGHVLLPQQRFIFAAIAAQALRLFGHLRYRLIRRLRPAQPRILEKPLQYGQRIALIGFELHQRALTS